MRALVENPVDAPRGVRRRGCGGCRRGREVAAGEQVARLGLAPFDAEHREKLGGADYGLDYVHLNQGLK